MPHLHLYDIGEKVVLQGMEFIHARILSKSNSTVAVEVHETQTGKRYATTWAPLTLVRKWLPPHAPSQPPEPKPVSNLAPVAVKAEKAVQKPPQKPVEKAEKPTKTKPELDVFGVRKGTMAAAVNAYLLQKKKNVTVADVLANVEGSKKDNVNSHLRRMVGDGLITNSGEGKLLVVSVPKGVK
jgi:hypothetical protein